MKHVTIRALAAAGANGNSTDFLNTQPQGLGAFIVDITAVSGTSPTVTVTIEGLDPTSGKYYTILASTALNAPGTTVLNVAPGITAVANSFNGGFVPQTFRVKWVIGGSATPTVTFSVGANLA